MEQKDSALFSVMSYSYTYFSHHYLALLNHPAYKSCEYMDTEVHMICQEMQTLFLSMPTLLGAEEDFKETYAKKLIAFRDILENKYRLLTSYKRELQHTSSLFNLKNSLENSTFEDFGMSEHDALEIDFSMLAKDCTQFVFAASDLKSRQYKASSLLPHIPMRMTKDNFLAYVEKALHKIHIENTPSSAKRLISILNQQFAGTNYIGYGKELPDIALSLEELQNTTDVDAFFELTDLLDETLTHLLEMLTELYAMICSFSNLLIFDGLTFNTLTDMHLSFYDLYCSIQNILARTDDAEILMETLPERIETIKDELEITYEKSRKANLENPLFLLADTYLNMSLSYVFGFDTSKHEPYGPEVTAIFNGFIDTLRTQLTNLAPQPRKLRMQYFMSVLPFMMNDQSFYSYMLQGFSGSVDLKRNLFTSMYLTTALEQSGYFDTDEDGMIPYDFDDHTLEDTSHAHDCCDGHTHSHDHDCCGGHTHSHDHDCCGGHTHSHDHDCCGGHTHSHEHDCCGGHTHGHEH